MPNPILIVYYSQTGNTRRIAELIQQQTNGTIHEILPEVPYKSLYLGGGARVKRERQSENWPPLQSGVPDLTPYPVIFLGTPNWGNSISHPLWAFLNEADLTGKHIFPFCTHGGGGPGHIEADIRELAPGAEVQGMFEIYGNGGPNAKRIVAEWLAAIFPKGVR